jgi:Yip1 domain
MALASTSNTLTDRMQRAARLDTQLYAEVEADRTATTQALLVVVIVAVASGIGAAVLGGLGTMLPSLFAGVMREIFGWAVFSFAAFYVGTRMFGGTATWGGLLRTLGFAHAPGVLYLFTFIPVLGPLIALAAFVWTLIASYIAVRQAHRLDGGKTIATVIVAAVATMLVWLVLGILTLGRGYWF